jgi:hypothetical protein
MTHQSKKANQSKQANRQEPGRSRQEQAGAGRSRQEQATRQGIQPFFFVIAILCRQATVIVLIYFTVRN